MNVRSRVAGPARLALVVSLTACAGPPWYMGAPLDGRPSIPATTALRSWKQQRAEAARAHAAGETVAELAALMALDEVDRLLPEHRPRLGLLLERRAAEFHALGRAVPEDRDLERAARVSAAHGAGLLGERAAAARAAGDAWLALGATTPAREAYDRARALGGQDLDVRVLALWGHPPPEATPLAELRAAVATLPLRAVPPFALAYVSRGGTDAATLGRGLAAARQESAWMLVARLEGASRLLQAPGAEGPNGGAPEEPDAAADAPAEDGSNDAPPPEKPVPVPADLERWVLRGATVAARLLPLVAAHPELLADGARALRWVELLLGEDPTSPDVLELAAGVFGRAARYGGTERMLGELVYVTADRAAGLERAARVWERLGRGREACVTWLRAARWRDDPDDPTWRTALTCARREAGVAEPRQIRDYVLARARPERRAAVAAALDAP